MNEIFTNKIAQKLPLAFCVFDENEDFIFCTDIFKKTVSCVLEGYSNTKNFLTQQQTEFSEEDFKDDEKTYKIITLNNSNAHQEFISTVSHELRTPLTSIKGFSDTMLSASDKLSKEQQQKFLSIISAQAARLTRLVENLLEITNLTKKTKLVYKDFNFKEFLKPIILLFEKKYTITSYETQIQDDLPELYTDKDCLEQIMNNLIDNASKYSPENSTVTIEAKYKDNAVHIIVYDKADKIPQNEFNNIFNKFARIDNHLTRKTEGSGLGLYITKKLVDKINGEISVENYEDGNVFTLKLPVYSTQERMDLKLSEQNYDQ